MSQEETVTARYMVFCGNPAPGGLTYPFEFLEPAPASLCRPHGLGVPAPSEDDNGPFLISLVERHHDEILRSRAWECITCGKPAREIFHSAVAFLSPNSILAPPDFEPTVLDTAAPICFSGGACDRNAERVIHDFARNVLVQRPWQMFVASKTCDTCGKKSGVKVCRGCKLIAYCSTEFQARRWPLHKKQCKRAQREAQAQATTDTAPVIQ